MTESPNFDYKFDLSPISNTLYTEWLRFRWAITVSAVATCSLGAIAFAYFAAVDTIGGRFHTAGLADLAFVCFFSGMAALLTLGGQRVRRPAVSMRVTSDGIWIEYLSTRPLSIPWVRPKFRLKITPVNSPSLQIPLRLVQFWTKPRIYMTVEAANAISIVAQSQDKDVVTVRDSNSVSGESVIIRDLRT